jgi:hypothetical protein
MPRFVNRLSQAAINNTVKGMHADGGGLYLHVNARGAKSWIFRYMKDGRAREMGLGSVHTIGLPIAGASCSTASTRCRIVSPSGNRQGWRRRAP